jgi:hypothetical protein
MRGRCSLRASDYNSYPSFGGCGNDSERAKRSRPMQRKGPIFMERCVLPEALLGPVRDKPHVGFAFP